MIAADTPTLSKPRGVKPICTRSPRCPLHELNLRDALAAQKPVAILMATPAYCQVAVCGPVLDVLLSQRQEFGSRVQMIHAEVYADGPGRRRHHQSDPRSGPTGLSPAV